MTTDWKALCTELVDELEVWISYGDEVEIADAHELIDRAREALARPEPEGPSEAQILEAVRHLYGDQTAADMGAADDLLTARAVLARWGRPTPQPVPVAERLPGPGDCDEQGRCRLGADAQPQR